MAREKKSPEDLLRRAAELLLNYADRVGLGMRAQDVRDLARYTVGGVKLNSLYCEFSLSFGTAVTMHVEAEFDTRNSSTDKRGHSVIPVYPKISLSWPARNEDAQVLRADLVLYQQALDLAEVLRRALSDDKYEWVGEDAP